MAGRVRGASQGTRRKRLQGQVVMPSFFLRWSVSRYICTGASESVNVSGDGSHKLSTWWNKEACIPRDSAYRLRNRSGKDRFVYGRFVRLRGRALNFPSAEELP